VNSPSPDINLGPVDLSKAIIQSVWTGDPITLDVLRLDRIHPVISGNKWFKLHKYLDAAIEGGHSGLITSGGAHSNHIVATAAACLQNNLLAVGLIRGEEPAEWSASLQDAKKMGMELHFLPRQLYRDKELLHSRFQSQYPRYLWVNEGGQGEPGVEGAAAIGSVYDLQSYHYLFCAVGTGTMMAGLARSAANEQIIAGVPVLKISHLADSELANWIRQFAPGKNIQLLGDFHGGAYARIDAGLLNFMNRWWEQHRIESDFVYTAKLFRAIEILAGQGYFPPGARVLAIHSGGLQGNRSLPTGSLRF